MCYNKIHHTHMTLYEMKDPADLLLALKISDRQCLVQFITDLYGIGFVVVVHVSIGDR